MSLVSGSRLGSYEIGARLGAGGMGEVFRAKDTRLGRDVAIKVLPDDVAANPDRLARLEREAKTVAALNHPNVVTLFSFEEASGVRFLTMELVEGRSLDQLITPGGLPIARVLSLAIPLSDALSAAHERGVVHRDLKPGNVMVTRDDRVKVLDFGLATRSAQEPSLDVGQAPTVDTPISTPGRVSGTVPYMAPEQVRGEATDARTDLFAFGILLFELITGKRPFAGVSSADVASAILRDTPPSLRALRVDVSHDLGRVVERCLEKDPERRAQSAKGVRNDLEMVRRDLESGGNPATVVVAPLMASLDEVPSVAVLPFENRSRREDDEVFADGMTEDVIAQLCKVRTLRVISRTSVMPFKNHGLGLKDIATRLGVATLLEGTIRRLGDRVRIVAQLTDAATGRNLWAETYDRQLTDIFGIQTDVALQIASALKAELSPRERERIHKEPTRDVQAYERYLRGRHSLIRFTGQEMLRSIDYFQFAIERDPGFALAYVGLAVAYTELSEAGVLGREQAGPRAKESAAKALELDPDLGEAHCALAYASLTFDFDWEGAEAGFERALELSPGHADAYDLYGRMCSGLERFDEAIALCARARELDPLTHRADHATSLLRVGRYDDAATVARQGIALDPYDPRLRATLGWTLFRQHRVGEGIAELERAVSLAPGDEMWLAQLGQAYALSGETPKAREIVGRLENPSRPQPASPYHLAYLHTGLGDPERALDYLERAFEKGSGAMVGIRGSFLFAPLRGHPRFDALLKRMRLGPSVRSG